MRPLCLLLLVACSSTPNPGGSGGGNGGGGGGGGSGSVNRPDAGCRSGFVACGAVCADLTADSTHCGACSTVCGSGSCVDAGCNPSVTTCQFGAICGGECITDRGSNVIHCGSCFNTCAGSELCIDGACTSSGGSGTSCTAPLLIPSSAERTGFFVPGAGDATYTHTCGPLNAIPTKWFRFTGTKSNVNVSVRSSHSTDQLVLSIFSSSACDQPVLVGCSAETQPAIQLMNAQNQTYFVGVGAVSVTAGDAASLKVDR